MRRVLAFVSLVILASAALAQDVPTKITWIRYYEVERGREADFLRFVREAVSPVLQPMVASKAAVAWGVAVPLTRDDETWTHVVYVGLPDWSGVDRVATALEPAGALASSVRRQHDVVLRHLSQGGTQAAMPKYINYETYVIKPGRTGEAVALYNEWAKPMFISPAVAAKVPIWGFSAQGVDSSEPWTHMTWEFLSDLTAIDTMDDAMDAMEPRKLQGFDVRLRDLSEPDKHRSQILRLITP
jgi:hypothetical protein